MQSIYGFYESGLGDRLIDPSYYSEQIVEFLQREQQEVANIQVSFDLLIEVGCANGRYLDWAIAHNKRYIGIDFVEHYIRAGQQRVLERRLSSEKYQFIVGDGEKLSEVIEPNALGITAERCLVLFPFNSFGNMQRLLDILTSLQKIGLPFLISSYLTNRYATACRLEYYQRCGYRDLQIRHTQEGICFTSADGLYSLAYHPAYLCRLCERYQIPVSSLVTPNSINVFYISCYR
jgi:hypothetical protein